MKSNYFSDMFDEYKPIVNKLVNFGFSACENGFVFESLFFDGQFKLQLFVNKSGEITIKIFDEFSGDEYALAYATTAIGSFVGEVRLAAEQLLTEIRDKCFEKTIFKWRQTSYVRDYIGKKYGCELEFLWQKFPDDAIWRRKDNKKWFGLLMKISKRKLGFDDDTIVEVIDLRKDVNDTTLVDNKKIFEGYHMNKKSWMTIVLDGTLKNSELEILIEKSYYLAGQKAK